MEKSEAQRIDSSCAVMTMHLIDLPRSKNAINYQSRWADARIKGSSIKCCKESLLKGYILNKVPHSCNHAIVLQLGTDSKAVGGLLGGQHCQGRAAEGQLRVLTGSGGVPVGADVQRYAEAGPEYCRGLAAERQRHQVCQGSDGGRTGKGGANESQDSRGKMMVDCGEYIKTLPSRPSNSIYLDHSGHVGKSEIWTALSPFANSKLCDEIFKVQNSFFDDS